MEYTFKTADKLVSLGERMKEAAKHATESVEDFAAQIKTQGIAKATDGANKMVSLLGADGFSVDLTTTGDSLILAGKAIEATLLASGNTREEE